MNRYPDLVSREPACPPGSEVERGYHDQMGQDRSSLLEASEILIDAYTRIQELVHRSADGLTQEQLAYRPEEGSNSIAWLIWHLTRIQDGHLAAATGREEAWVTEGWADRFGMPGDTSVNGQGDGPAEVAALRPDGPDVLLGYHDAVVDRTRAYLRSVDGRRTGPDN